jgi:hypothetical protein
MCDYIHHAFVWGLFHISGKPYWMVPNMFTKSHGFVGRIGKKFLGKSGPSRSLHSYFGAVGNEFHLWKFQDPQKSALSVVGTLVPPKDRFLSHGHWFLAFSQSAILATSRLVVLQERTWRRCHVLQTFALLSEAETRAIQRRDERNWLVLWKSCADPLNQENLAKSGMQARTTTKLRTHRPVVSWFLTSGQHSFGMF